MVEGVGCSSFGYAVGMGSNGIGGLLIWAAGRLVAGLY
jgi:hypothetical protein